MKIQCDVCGKEEASVFCCADEAALCGDCDRRVHLANKLAGKHQRFSLLSPSSSSASLHPRCDVCQEKKAFLFCQEDRAILCRDCDGPIHTANELTRKHNRFVLTGVKLSPTAAPADPSESIGPGVTGVTSSSSSSLKEDLDSRAKKRKKVPAAEPNLPAAPPPLARDSSSGCNSDSEASAGGKAKVAVVEAQTDLVGDTTSIGGDGSSISDYLIKTLPGWRVEDLLLDYPSPSLSFYSPAPSHSLYKMGDMGEGFVPFAEADLDGNGFGSPDGPAWWVPQVPQAPPQAATTISFSHGGLVGSSGQERWMTDDGGFTVPQMMMSQQPQCGRRPGRSVWYT